jgi:hypothetical protein
MSSGDWRFASIRGNLKWTSPALANGGVELFSELSPTLIVGHQEEGDVLPVDYIKLSTVRSATLTSDTGIELVRDGASAVLLVAPSAANAAEWHKMISIAISEGKAPSLVKQTAPAGGVPAAAPPPAAAPVERGTFKPPQPSPPLFAAQSSTPLTRPVQAAEDQQAAMAPRTAAIPVTPPSSAAAPGFSLKLGSLPSSSTPVSAFSPQAGLAAADKCAFDPTGSHEFRPLQSVTGAPLARAQTTTVATHIDMQKPGLFPQPLVRPSAAEGFRPGQPGWGHQGATAVNLTPQLSDLPRPTNGKNDSASLQGFASRPLPDGRENNFGHVANNGFPSMREGEYQTSSTAGTAGFARKRSGMLVDVPPNPQVNRNIAPNVSAIWKEWTGPDGVLYVSHEPTGTIQRRIGETDEFETLIEGNDEIPTNDMALRPYSGTETAVDLNSKTIKNLGRYGGNAGGVSGNVASPNVYREENVTTPRGQYSPTRRTALQSLVQAPRQSQSAYTGRRVHQLTLGPAGEEAPTASVIEHQIQILGATGLRWDPVSGTTVAPDGTSRGDIGPSTLEKQWEHVRRILLQGRLFKKHALRTTQSSFRFVFLTADNAYVVCVPTSQVPVNFSQDPMTFGSVTETVQYYGPESRAIALNTITHVSLGSDEAFVRQRRGVVPENVFCIVSRTHAFILECNTAEEAKYFSDAWTFFLYHSKPVNLQKNKAPQVKNPITFGTRAGIAF